MMNLHSFFIFHSFFNVKILIFSKFFQKNFDFFRIFRKKSEYFLIYAIFQLKTSKNRGVSCNTYIPLYKESEPPGKESKNARVNRWKLALQEYRYTIEFIKGSDNIIADSLSRLCLLHETAPSHTHRGANLACIR